MAPRHPPPRTEHDTTADDCVLDFLGDLDQSLWILCDTARAEANAFANAARPHDHIGELRRLLRRLHALLATWETQALQGAARSRTKDPPHG